MHLLTQSAVLRALGWCLFDSCWQMAILWLIYISFTNIFKTASASVRHGLALLLTAAGTLWTLLTFLQAWLTPQNPGVADWLSRTLITDLDKGPLTTVRSLLQTWLPYVSAGYLLFLAILFVRYTRQYLQTSHLKDSGLSRIGAEHRLFVEETRRRMGIRRPVQVWLSSLVESPSTLGFLKPVILIPVASIANLSTHQVEALLLHELAHIRRHDYLLNLGLSVLEIFFFFNPFCRWLIRDIKREREHRCDDLVIQFRYDPKDYVSALLSLARTQAGPRLALAADGDNDRLLLRRARRILQLPATHDRIQTRSLLILVFTLMFSGLVGLGLTSLSPDRMDSAPLIGALPAFRAGEDLMTDKDGQIIDTVTTPAPLIEKTPALRIIAVAVVQKTRTTGIQTAARKQTPGHKRSMHIAGEDLISVAAVDEDPESYDNNNLGHFATDVVKDDREYSIKTVVAAKTPAAAEAQPVEDAASRPMTPFVPNSSFSYTFIQDSTRPDQQFVYLQRLAVHDAETAVKRLEAALQLQIHVLRMTAAGTEHEAMVQKKQILEDQLRLQQQYLQRQQELIGKFEKIGGTGKQKKLRRIVEI